MNLDRARLALLLPLFFLTMPVLAQTPDEPRIALVVSYSTTAQLRSAFLQSLDQAQFPQFEKWKQEGLLYRYDLLFSSYADTGSWDAMAILLFENAAHLARWKQIERSAPGGLDRRTLEPVAAIETAQVDLHRARTVDEPPRNSVFLVIPYEYLISLPDYKEYFDGYVLPQLEGWIAEEALRGYSLYIARHGAGRLWNALLVLEYWDEASLQERPAVTAKVRKLLASDPVWSDFAANKQNIRQEGRITIAERIR